MKTARKALMLVLCAALLVSATVMGTLAYLQDTTEVVANTFAVGQVKIDLDEAMVDEYGIKAEYDGRVKANTYKLIPGHTYTKDPTVHVEEGSEVSYVFVKVENGIEAIEAEGDTTIAAQIDANGWAVLEDVENVFYKENVDAREGAVELVVFESFVIADNAELVDYASAQAQVNITAYAIQADGFDSAAAAWAAGAFA